MVQSPMLSCPLKQTGEIDWIYPLKGYIRMTYGDDPEKYAEECATLNRLRQDMRGAGSDSASGRDLLYRYYGQLELLDLRFPVDENHIKISFTWFDAFTHKPTSQYSLAFEKASVIFNISAVLSCHAAVQNRSEDNGLKTAYHSFQASAGMFTYINENFLHAPSTDLSRDTVKTLISITLAQGQEVFLEKQIRDGKKAGLLAKLASQAHFLYAQGKEGLEAEVSKGVFDVSWPKFITMKAAYMLAVSEYYQALADDDSNSHGTAIARLQAADKSAKAAYTAARAFPASPSATSNLGSDTRATLEAMTKRQAELIQEKLTALIKDNDFIYHQTVPAEASLAPVTKLPAAKAIPVSELYQGQDIQRIIGPDIFQKIVPMSVTESASMYDEEKAKLVRSEAEKVEQANGEMAASLDYLKLPSSLNVLKGGLDQEMEIDPEFKRWCNEMASHEPFRNAFEQLQKDKMDVLESLAKSSKQLDMEESVCEKMRSKYGGEWTQQPSSRLTSTLRSDIKSYRETVDEASGSDTQLSNTARQYETDFEEMRSAGERDEADVLYQQALIKAGSGKSKARSSGTEGNLLDEDYSEGGPSVSDQIAKVEDLLSRLNLVKRERMQVLKDLKEKIHTDDISNVLILNKKSIANHENQLFQAELEKFRPLQNRLITTVHKQASLLKDLTKAYGNLLQDKRVRSEQSKYEAISKSRSTVLNRYRRVRNAHEDLIQGLMRAQGFYSEMKESVDSLEKNVESFVSNRRAEGAQLLSQIEQSKSASTSGQAAAERERLQQLMERMSMEPTPSQSSPSRSRPPTVPPQPPYSNGLGSPPPITSYNTQPVAPVYSGANPDPRFTIPPRESPAPPSIASGYQYPAPQSHQPQQLQKTSPSINTHAFSQGSALPVSQAYNPMAYPDRGATSSQVQQPFSPNAQQPSNSFFPQPQQQPFQQYQQLQPQSPPLQLNFTSSHPQFSQPQQQQRPPSRQTSYPAPYNVPTNYVPPPPPPGPPGGGSTTQYPPQQGQPYAAGPGGYAGSQSFSVQSPHGRQQGQGAQGQADPWAGLNAWR
jgi:hypothetical protein